MHESIIKANPERWKSWKSEGPGASLPPTLTQASGLEISESKSNLDPDPENLGNTLSNFHLSLRGE